jgi:UDP-glucose 4-epimerase
MSLLYPEAPQNYILITGGLGYIGSHTVIKLLNQNTQVIIVDNLSNSDRIVLKRINQITGFTPLFFEGDIRNSIFLEGIFRQYHIVSVIHFAGLKDVSESIEKPTEYFSNNVIGSKILIEVMTKFNVKKIIFSSSANVYGNPISIPIVEDHPINPTNPYGQSKWNVEEMLCSLKTKDPSWKVGILRYFNPLGAHESGLIGESSLPIKTNIMPAMCNAAYHKQSFSIYGNDYTTVDGTPIRDFIHVQDLAAGHLAALKFLDYSHNRNEVLTVNLGTGKPTTIMELVRTFKDATGVNLKFELKPRRKGDVSVSYTNPNKALKILSWKAHKSIFEMCQDAWRWKLHESQQKFTP